VLDFHATPILCDDKDKQKNEMKEKKKKLDTKRKKRREGRQKKIDANIDFVGKKPRFSKIP